MSTFRCLDLISNLAYYYILRHPSSRSGSRLVLSSPVPLERVFL